MARPAGEMSDEDRMAALQAAASEGNWDEFAGVLAAWMESAPDDEWLKAGLVVAATASGGDDEAERERVAHVDGHLADLLGIVHDVRAGDKTSAAAKIAREIGAGNRDPALLKAYRWAEPALVEPVKHLFSAPHLVAGCVLTGSEIASMASKGARMSADSLGNRVGQMWHEVTRLNSRIDLGIIESVEVMAEDGGLVVASSGADTPTIAAALVAVSSVVGEVSARAQAVIDAMESEDD